MSNLFSIHAKSESFLLLFFLFYICNFKVISSPYSVANPDEGNENYGRQIISDTCSTIIDIEKYLTQNIMNHSLF